MVRYPERWIAIEAHRSIEPIRFRSPSSRTLYKREYLLVKSEAQYYREYINLVELKYGKCSNEFRVFRKLYQDCKEQRITNQEIEYRVIKMFKGQGRLLLKFCTTVLPYLHPLATKDEVDRANQFIHSVESAFSNNQDRCVSVKYLVFMFQDGKLTLKEMTVKEIMTPTGWPLGLENINTKLVLGAADSASQATVVASKPSSLHVPSSSLSSFSSSCLETESTASFFIDQSVTLGRLIGMNQRPGKAGASQTGHEMIRRIC